MEFFAWVKKIFTPQTPVNSVGRSSDSSHGWSSSNSRDDAGVVFNDSDLYGSGSGDSSSDLSDSASSDSSSDGGGGDGGGSGGGD